jgi:hypothetical protein
MLYIMSYHGFFFIKWEMFVRMVQSHYDLFKQDILLTTCYISLLGINIPSFLIYSSDNPIFHHIS